MIFRSFSRRKGWILFCVATLALNTALGQTRPVCARLVLSPEDTFAVEEYFPNVRIHLGRDGMPIIPHNKAFLAWRQRTPPHIPDICFAFHYLNSSDQLNAAATALAQPENGFVPTSNSASPFVWDMGSEIEGLSNSKWTQWSYLFYELDGKNQIVFQKRSVPHRTHAVLSEELKRIYPDARIYFGGLFGGEIERDESGRAHLYVRLITNGSYVPDWNPHGRLGAFIELLFQQPGHWERFDYICWIEGATYREVSTIDLGLMLSASSK